MDRGEVEKLAARERADLIDLIADVEAHDARGLLRRMVFFVDLLAGAIWLLAPASSWSSPTYKPARTLLDWLPTDWQMRPIGAVVITAALVIQLTGIGHREMYYWLGSLLIFHWTFWAVLFTAAVLDDGQRRGVLGPVLCLFVAGCHETLIKTSRRTR